MPGYTHLEGLTSADIARLRATYAPLAESVRHLIDATIRSEVDADEVAAVKADIDRATARLRAKQIDGPFGSASRPTGIGCRGAIRRSGSVTRSPHRW